MGIAGGLQLGEDFFGEMEGGVGGGDAAVDGGLQKEFFDLVAGDAAVEGGAQVHAELIGTIQGDQHCQSDEAASFTGEARTGPNLSKDVARDEVLKLAVELVPIALRAVHVGIAEDGAPHGHALLIAFTFVHSYTSSRREKTDELRVEPLGGFEIREMRGFEFGVLGPRDPLGEETTLGGRSGGIASA